MTLYPTEIERLEAELFEEPIVEDEDRIDAVIVEEREASADHSAADFADLDSLLDEAMAAKKAAADLQTKYSRLKRLHGSHNPDHLAEKQALIASIRNLEEGIVWQTTANVALIHVQTCTACGSTHSFFQGWWTEQMHKTDPTTRRLLKGHTVESLPEKVERHAAELVEACANCVESQILIAAATQGKVQ